MWLHPKQKTGYINGNELYKYLQDENLLESCLDFGDLKEIQKQGTKFFKKHFGKNKFVYAWKGIVRYLDGNLNVPCLCESGVKVVLYWRWTAYDWSGYNPALRFASSAKNSDTQTSELNPLSLEKRIEKIEDWIKKEAHFTNPFD